MTQQGQSQDRHRAYVVQVLRLAESESHTSRKQLEHAREIRNMCPLRGVAGTRRAPRALLSPLYGITHFLETYETTFAYQDCLLAS